MINRACTFYIVHIKLFIKEIIDFTRQHSTVIKVTVPITAALICIAYIPNIDDSFRNNLLAEVMGSGLLAAIITYTFFRLQNKNEFNARKIRAELLYKKIVLPDFQEIISDFYSTSWDIGLDYRFYVDSSRINPLFASYTKHLGKVIDSQIKRIVREVHHSNNIGQAYDTTVFMFVRAKLYTKPSTDIQILKYLNLQSPPNHANQIISIMKNDTIFSGQILSMLGLKSAADTLIGEIARMNEIRD